MAKVRWYLGVPIFPRNIHGMYTARVDVPGGGVAISADTLQGIKGLIRHYVKGN